MNNSGSGTGSGFLSGYTGGFLGMNRQQQSPGGFLGLNRNPQQNQGTNNPPHMQKDNVQSSMEIESAVEKRPAELREPKDSAPRGFTMNFGKEKTVGRQPSNVTINFNDNSSDEDEPSYEEGNGGIASGGKGKNDDAPWQRMKWTDNVVRLLIQVVASVGEDGILESPDGVRRRSGIIRKGKWKTVSKILMSKGYHVSPQQCEDKFNDLNKRYKKLNDILGRGMSCRVVENPGLLFKMHHLSEKAKEDVKKLLGSKHLFYREICAYHNGQKLPDCADLSLPVRSTTVAEQIWNHSDDSPVGANCSKDKDQCSKGNNVSDGEGDEENDESEDDESDDDTKNNASEYRGRDRMNDAENTRAQCSQKDKFQAEIDEMFDDPKKSQWERKQWIKKRLLQLREERIGIQAEAVELEKRRLKWLRFCNQKEFELEMARLDKEKLMLENDQNALQLKQKELELESTSPEASFSLTSFSIDIMGRKYPINSAKHH